jgi:hypothetical protein
MTTTAEAAPVDGDHHARRPDLSAYAQPQLARSLLDLATSVRLVTFRHARRVRA